VKIYYGVDISFFNNLCFQSFLTIKNVNTCFVIKPAHQCINRLKLLVLNYNFIGKILIFIRNINNDKVVNFLVFTFDLGSFCVHVKSKSLRNINMKSSLFYSNIAKKLCQLYRNIQNTYFSTRVEPWELIQ
jgi:hypothetical protein